MNKRFHCRGCKGIFAKWFGHRCKGGNFFPTCWISCTCECNKVSDQYEPPDMSVYPTKELNE